MGDASVGRRCSKAIRRKDEVTNENREAVFHFSPDCQVDWNSENPLYKWSMQELLTDILYQKDDLGVSEWW